MLTTAEANIAPPVRLLGKRRDRITHKGNILMQLHTHNRPILNLSRRRRTETRVTVAMHRAQDKPRRPIVPNKFSVIIGDGGFDTIGISIMAIPRRFR